MDPTPFSPYALLIDSGLIGALLVVGTILRARIRVLQTMMVPAGVIAGFLGLAMGPNGLGCCRSPISSARTPRCSSSSSSRACR